MACRSMSKEAIELLIEAQADVNLDSGGTATLPIIQACSRSRVNDSLEKENIIRFLIEENWASVVRTRPENVLFSYPIHYASMSCSTQVMELFIKHGALAQLSEPDSLNRQPVHLASYNSLDVLRMLEVPREDFSARDVFGRLPFHCAVLSGHFDLLTHVFEKSKAADPDFTIDSPYSDGWTALHWAARATGILGWENNPKDLNSTQIIQYPLDEGADVCALAHVRPYGDSTLTQTDWLASDIASYHGATDLVSMLEEEKSRHSQDSKLANRSRRKVGEKDDVFFCDACALSIHGIHLACDTCYRFALCFKCSGWKSVLLTHDETHVVTWNGKETTIEEEVLANDTINHEVEKQKDTTSKAIIQKRIEPSEDSHVTEDSKQKDQGGDETEEQLEDDDDNSMDQVIILEDSDDEIG